MAYVRGGGLGWPAIIPVLGSEKSCRPLHPTTVLGEALASWFVCWHVRRPHMGAGHFPLIRIESFYWNCSSMTRFKFKPKHCYHQAHWIIDFRTNKNTSSTRKESILRFYYQLQVVPSWTHSCYKGVVSLLGLNVGPKLSSMWGNRNRFKIEQQICKHELIPFFIMRKLYKSQI